MYICRCVLAQVLGGVLGQQEAVVSRVSTVWQPWVHQASLQNKDFGSASPPQEQRQEQRFCYKGKTKKKIVLGDHPIACSIFGLFLFYLFWQPKMEVECVKVSRQPQPPSESWGPAGHRGAVPNHETWASPISASLHGPHCLMFVRYRLTRHLVPSWETVTALHFFFLTFLSFCPSS